MPLRVYRVNYIYFLWRSRACGPSSSRELLAASTFWKHDEARSHDAGKDEKRNY